MRLAFECGKLLGQVEYQQQIENDNLADNLIECIYAKKTAMPISDISSKEPVAIVRLKSEKWKQGLKETALMQLEQAILIAKNHILEP